jgi:hypothetical protein
MTTLIDTPTNEISIIEEKGKEIIQKAKTALDIISSDAETDYSFIRNKLKTLIDKSEYAIEKMSDLASMLEHPRAYEVLATLLKNTSEITNQLITLQEKRLDIQSKIFDKNSNLNDNSNEKAKNLTQNNTTIFVGSTQELQKFLANSNLNEK